MQQSQHTQASVLYRNTGLNPIAETEPNGEEKASKQICASEESRHSNQDNVTCGL